MLPFFFGGGGRGKERFPFETVSCSYVFLRGRGSRGRGSVPPDSRFFPRGLRWCFRTAPAATGPLRAFEQSSEPAMPRPPGRRRRRGVEITRWPSKNEQGSKGTKHTKPFRIADTFSGPESQNCRRLRRLHVGMSCGSRWKCGH